MGTLSVVALAVWISITGLALLEFLRCDTQSRVSRLGLAIGAGFVISCLVLNASLALTSELHFWPLFLVYAAASGYWLVKRARAHTTWRFERRDLLFVVVGFAFVGMFNGSGKVPFAGYDSKAIYGIKAKALLSERDVRGPLFQDPDAIHYHGDYPLGLPVLIALSGWVAESSPEVMGAEPHSGPVADWVRQSDSVDHYMPLATLWGLALMLVVAGHIRERKFGVLGNIALFSLALPVVMIYPWAGGGSWSLAGADIPLAFCIRGRCACELARTRRQGRAGVAGHCCTLRCRGSFAQAGRDDRVGHLADCAGVLWALDQTRQVDGGDVCRRSRPGGAPGGRDPGSHGCFNRRRELRPGARVHRRRCVDETTADSARTILGDPVEAPHGATTGSWRFSWPCPWGGVWAAGCAPSPYGWGCISLLAW